MWRNDTLTTPTSAHGGRLAAALLSGLVLSGLAPLSGGCGGGGSDDPLNNNVWYGDGGGACDPGAFLGCDGEDLILCNVTGDGSTRVPCGSAGCSEAGGRCNDCDASRPESCEGDLRLSCSAEGVTLESELCPWGCREAAGEAACHACRPDAVECHDASTLVSCDGSGEILEEEACPFGCALGEGRCNACEPLTVACVGDDLTACDPQGQVEQQEHCANGCHAEELQCQCAADSCLDEWTLLRCGGDALPAGAELCLNGCTEDAGGGRCNECLPGSVFCDGRDVLSCGSDGLVESVEACSMGCDEWEVPGRCRLFMPRYVNADSLTLGQTDFNTMGNVVIDTTAKTIRSVGNPVQTWTPPEYTLSQAYGPQLWVVHFRDVSIGALSSVRVVGSRGLALVASGSVTIRGSLDASARGATPGAGGRHSGSAAWNGPVGTPDGQVGAALPGGTTCENQRPSGGGGGHAADGGDGGSTFTGSTTIAGGANGTVVGSAPMVPILGGGRGGGNPGSTPGAGGGVLIITARDSITVMGSPTPGRVDVSGGGGQNYGTGGGAAGSAFFEAPFVQIDGWVRAVGGGGACGDLDGAGSDGFGTGNGGEPSGSGTRGGDGGYSDDRATFSPGSNGVIGTCGPTGHSAGGGGGGAGRVRFRVATEASHLTLGAGAVTKFLPCGGSAAGCLDVFDPF